MVLGSRKFIVVFLLTLFGLPSLSEIASAGRYQRKGCPFLLNRLEQKIRLPRLPRVPQIDMDRIQRPVFGIQDAVVAAVVSGGHVLMNLRGGEVGRDHWGVLGGKVDPGETLYTALVRELTEEAGIDRLQSARVIFVHYHYDNAKREIYRVFVVRAEMAAGVVPSIREPDKVLALEWHPIGEPPQPLFSEFSAYQDELY